MSPSKSAFDAFSRFARQLHALGCVGLFARPIDSIQKEGGAGSAGHWASRQSVGRQILQPKFEERTFVQQIQSQLQQRTRTVPQRIVSCLFTASTTIVSRWPAKERMVRIVSDNWATIGCSTTNPWHSGLSPKVEWNILEATQFLWLVLIFESIKTFFLRLIVANLDSSVILQRAIFPRIFRLSQH